MTVDPLTGVSPQTRQEANSAKNAEVRGVFASPWEMLETICAEHGLGGVEIWLDEDARFNIDVDTIRGEGATLASAVGDALVKLGPPAKTEETT